MKRECPVAVDGAMNEFFSAYSSLACLLWPRTVEIFLNLNLRPGSLPGRFAPLLHAAPKIEWPGSHALNQAPTL